MLGSCTYVMPTTLSTIRLLQLLPVDDPGLQGSGLDGDGMRQEMKQRCPSARLAQGGQALGTGLPALFR